MKRLAGITISAVVAFAGSALTLLFGALMGFSATVAVPNGTLPHGYGYIVSFMVVAALLFAGWGISSGVGLLDLREWARMSMLVFAALLLIFCIPGALIFLFVKLPIPANSPNPEVAQHILAIVRVVAAGFYAGLSVLGAVWVYYFNRQIVKAEFAARGSRTIAVSEAAMPPAGHIRKRPLSITIIAGLMMFGVASLPLFAVLQFPILFLGYFFTGQQALLIIFGYSAMQAAIAYGLWELKTWGRSLTIYYFNFAIFNSVISVILPGAQARYEAAMATMLRSATGTVPPMPVQMQIPPWFGLVFALPVIAIQLGFVIASKKAFESTPHDTSFR